MCILHGGGIVFQLAQLWEKLKSSKAEGSLGLAVWLGLLQALKQEHEEQAIAHSCIISTAHPPTNLTHLPSHATALAHLIQLDTDSRHRSSCLL